MTVLEHLATTKARFVVDLIERHKSSAEADSALDGPMAWNNKPAWDNWKKKPVKFKKKRVYFHQKEKK